MGAFIIVLLITRIARRQFGYDVRGSLTAFAIAAALSIGVGSFGFSSDTVTPLQALPWVALGYGKFCLAFLIVDLDTAKRLKTDPGYLKTKGLLGLRPTTAWIPAAAVIAVGAAASFMLSQRTRQSEVPLVEAWQTLNSPEGLFTASLPGLAVESSSTQENPTGRPPILAHSFEVDQQGAWYAIQYMRFDDAHIDPSATVDRVLVATRDGMIRGMAGQLLSQRYVDHKGWPGLEAAFRASEGRDTVVGRARIVVVGRTLYTLITIGAPDQPTTRFFDSFEVLRASDEFRLPARVLPK